jgi:rod shape-determining protein MreB
MDFAAVLYDDSTIICKKGQGIVFNDAAGFSAAFKMVSTPLLRSCLFCIPCSLSEDELANSYKKIANAANVTDTEFIPSVLATAIGLGYNPEGGGACLSVDMSEHGTDIAIINGCEVISGGTIDDGLNSAVYDIKQYLEQKHGTDIDLAVAKLAFIETATLLLNDEVSFKIDEVGYFTGIDCYRVIYPHYTRIAKAILKALEECPEDVRINIKKEDVYIGGVGTQVTGLREFLANTLDVPVVIARDSINAAINGAGRLLTNDKLIKKIVACN